MREGEIKKGGGGEGSEYFYRARLETPEVQRILIQADVDVGGRKEIKEEEERFPVL
jgi:hypothetical protein